MRVIVFMVVMVSWILFIMAVRIIFGHHSGRARVMMTLVVSNAHMEGIWGKRGSGETTNIVKHFYDVDIIFFNSAQKPGFWHSVFKVQTSQNHKKV